MPHDRTTIDLILQHSVCRAYTLLSFCCSTLVTAIWAASNRTSPSFIAPAMLDSSFCSVSVGKLSAFSACSINRAHHQRLARRVGIQPQFFRQLSLIDFSASESNRNWRALIAETVAEHRTPAPTLAEPQSGYFKADIEVSVPEYLSIQPPATGLVAVICLM